MVETAKQLFAGDRWGLLNLEISPRSNEWKDTLRSLAYRRSLDEVIAKYFNLASIPVDIMTFHKEKGVNTKMETFMDSRTVGEFYSPTERDNWQRSPCPGLNTLANHGFINRNGRNITFNQVSDAASKVYG